MNYMSEVAHMLGVELEEEFKINDDSTNKFKLTNSGLFFLNHVGVWGSCDHKLTQLLNGKHEIIKLPKSILTEEEKEYLSNVIKPFRNRIKHIVKYLYEYGEYISIVYKVSDVGMSSVIFPSYDEGTTYKGMELGMEYTLEELGL